MKLNIWTSAERGRSLALANALGVSPPTVSDWCAGKKAVPLERCTAIERATEGAVTRQDLRPDDWQDIWPELAQSPTTISQAATETVAGEVVPHAPTGALRTGTVRRYANRRAQDGLSELDRRAKDGPPFQSFEHGEA